MEATGACLHERRAWLVVGRTATVHVGRKGVLHRLRVLHVGLACVGRHHLIPCRRQSSRVSASERTSEAPSSNNWGSSSSCVGICQQGVRRNSPYAF